MESAPFELDVCLVGGAGHVGLPFALTFARLGRQVGIYDIDEEALATIGSGVMPHLEQGATEALAEALAANRLQLSSSPSMMKGAEVVIVVIGTPIDEFLNPSLDAFDRVVEEVAEWITDDALLVLRSTVYPGTTERVAAELARRGRKVDVACCPERIAEGHALEEITSLPQIVGADDESARVRATRLFRELGVSTVETTCREAELAKLLTNTWRYIKFAIANQFFMMASDAGIDYDRVLHAIRDDYPRAQDLPGPGFSAGPCLLKDTMQLSAFSGSSFVLGHAAMQVNEGMPEFIVRELAKTVEVKGATVAILGMAFKAETDDKRASLSYKLRKVLSFAGARVLCCDPYVNSPDLVDVDVALEQAGIVIIGAPHRCYADLNLTGKHVVDIWGLTGGGRIRV